MSEIHPRILIFTGHGKGKTTAALGMILRAAGHGMSTFLLQFMKKNTTTGELKALTRLPSITVRQHGLGFVPQPDSPKFALHQQKAEEALKIAEEAVIANQFDLIVLDEICGAVAKGLITEANVLALIDKLPAQTVLVLTGRNAGQALIKKADTVSEIQMVKHGFQLGIPAGKGVEF
jgi:cob(I)alamin adenosyltransferase